MVAAVLEACLVPVRRRNAVMSGGLRALDMAGRGGAHHLDCCVEGFSVLRQLREVEVVDALFSTGRLLAARLVGHALVLLRLQRLQHRGLIPHSAHAAVLGRLR